MKINDTPGILSPLEIGLFGYYLQCCWLWSPFLFPDFQSYVGLAQILRVRIRISVLMVLDLHTCTNFQEGADVKIFVLSHECMGHKESLACTFTFLPTFAAEQHHVFSYKTGSCMCFPRQTCAYKCQLKDSMSAELGMLQFTVIILLRFGSDRIFKNDSPFICDKGMLLC